MKCKKIIILTIIFAMLFGMTALLPQKAYAKDDIAITIILNNNQVVQFAKEDSKYFEGKPSEGRFHWHSDTKKFEVSGADIQGIKVHNYGEEEVTIAFNNQNNVSKKTNPQFHGIVSETQYLKITSESAARAKITADKIEGKSITSNDVNISADLIKALHGNMYFENVDLSGPAIIKVDDNIEGLFSFVGLTLKNTTFNLKKIEIGDRTLGDEYLETIKWVKFENSSGSINAPSGDYAIDIGYSVDDSTLQFVDCGDIDLHSGDFYKSAIRFGSGKKGSPDIIFNKGVSELWFNDESNDPINLVKIRQPSDNNGKYGRFHRCNDQGNIIDDVASNIYIKRAGYRVTLDKNGAIENIQTPIVVEQDGLVPKPSKVTHPDPAKEFDGWWLFEDNKFVKQWNFETDTVTKDMTLKVKWANLHTVIFDTNGGTPQIKPKYVKHGGKILKPGAITNGDKQLKYWEKKGTATAYNFQNPVMEDLELVAKWVDKDEPIDKFKIKFEPFGGDPFPSEQTKNDGDYVFEPYDDYNPELDGFKFDHWMYINAFGELTKFDFSTYQVHEDRTLYAYYTPTAEKVMVYIASIENIEPQVTATIIDKGTVFEKPSTPTAPPGLFNHWYTGDLETYYFKDPVNNNLKINHWFSSINEYSDEVEVKIKPEGPHTLEINGTIQLKTEVQPPEAYNDVEWRSADPTIASVDSSGKVTAHKAGRTEIKAYYKQNYDKFDAVEIIVNPKPDSVNVKINETGPITIDNGTTTQLTYTITPDDAPNKNVRWSTSNDWVAIVDENGLVSAISDGEAWIKVTAEDGGNSDAIKIIVNKVGTTSADNYFGYAKATVKQGEELSLYKLRFTPSLAMEDSPHNLQGIDTNVLGDQEGTVDITFGDGSKKENVKVYVKVIGDAPQEYTVTVTNGTADKAKYQAGETVTITADAAPFGDKFDKWIIIKGTVTLLDETLSTTTFKMPAEAVEVKATYKAIEPSGTKYTLKVNNGTGSGDYAKDAVVDIEAAAPATGKMFDKWVIVSGTPTIADVNKAITKLTMPEEAVEITAMYKDIPAGTHLVTVTNGTGGGYYAKDETVTIAATIPADKEFVNWKVTTGTVILTDANAESTTFKMPDENVVVEAVLKDKNVTPTPGTATVKLDPATLNIKVGHIGILTATVSPDTAPDKTIVWKSSDPSIASVNNGIVNAHKKGVVVITATTVDGNSATAIVNVTEDGQTPPTPGPGYPVYPGYPTYPEYPYYPHWGYGNYIPPKIVIEVPETKVVTQTTEPKETPWVDFVKTKTIKLRIGEKAMYKKQGNTTDVIRMDATPFIKDGRTMVPIRFVAEALGYEVSWNQDKWEATLKNSAHKVVIPVKTDQIIVDGKAYTSDVKPILKDQRTYLSISNVCKALGLKENQNILWNQDKWEVTIIMDK